MQWHQLKRYGHCSLSVYVLSAYITYAGYITTQK